MEMKNYHKVLLSQINELQKDIFEIKNIHNVFKDEIPSDLICDIDKLDRMIDDLMYKTTQVIGREVLLMNYDVFEYDKDDQCTE